MPDYYFATALFYNLYTVQFIADIKYIIYLNLLLFPLFYTTKKLSCYFYFSHKTYNFLNIFCPFSPVKFSHLLYTCIILKLLPVYIFLQPCFIIIISIFSHLTSITQILSYLQQSFLQFQPVFPFFFYFVISQICS